MYLFALITAVLAAVTGLEWLARNILAFPVWKRAFHLDPGYASPAAVPSVRLSVVVACKDEEDTIEDCARHILRQDYDNFELVLVDDRSSDGTRRIIEHLAREDDRVRTVTIDELPEGWCGKNHAMQRGIEAADGEWIAMTDADCSLRNPCMLSKAMAYAAGEHADMVTLLPTLQMVGFWEKLLLPVCAGILLIWFPPKKVNDPRRKQAFANGQFMLMTREAYETIGRHEAVKGSLIEDIDIARRVKDRGLHLRFAPTRDLFEVRMYSSLRALVNGWIRIFIGAFRSLRGLLAELAILLGRGLAPLLTTILGWTMYLGHVGAGDTWMLCGIIATAALLLQLVMMVRYYRHAGAPPALGLLYHFTTCVVSAILVMTMCKLLPGATITWRDTVYDAGN